MTGVVRTVRRLRLRASSDAAATRAANTVEDALRTATLPDAGARVLLVHRLALGRIRAESAPAAVARALERAVARVGGEWRHGTASGAGGGNAVWFRDALEAHVALALRVAAGPEPVEWYWPLAVPRWTRGAGAERALREIAFSIATHPEAPAALPHWCAALVASGHEELLCRSLRPADLPALARAAALKLSGVRPGPALRPQDSPETSWPAAPASAPTPADARTTPARASRRSSGPPVRRFVDALLSAAGAKPRPEPPQRASPAEPSAAPAREPPNTPAAPAATDAGELSLADTGSACSPRPRTGGSQAPAPRGQQSGAAQGAAALLEAGSAAPGPAPVPTAAGGLLFLLNAFTTAGYAEWARAQAEGTGARVARQVLAGMLARLRVRLADPMHEIVMLPPEHGQSSPLDEAVIAAWDVALRTWLRRTARTGYAAVVLRPAAVAATPTHVDVHFAPGAVDLRVRRAGLDVDPGWVPWFGRVVSFHYDGAET